MADTPTEGEISMNSVKDDETSTDSPSENKETEDTQSAEGDEEKNTQQEDDAGDDDSTEDDATGGDDDDTEDDSKETPFHEHPRWKQRETEWDKRFNDQETRHQDDLAKIREDFGNDKKSAESKAMPSWFGGDQKQWDAYQADRVAEIKEAEDRVIKRFEGTKSAEQKAVEDATAFMKSEIVAIQDDKDLNPSGKPVDPNKLLKVVMDNELVDSKGRWNYRAGMKIMNASSKAPVKKTDNKKKIAGATTSESTGEDKPKAYKTTKDFQQNRPW